MFVVKYLGATNHLGTRFKILDPRHKGKARTYSWDYSLNNLKEQAISVLRARGITFDGFFDGYSEPWTENDKVYLFTSDFETSLTDDDCPKCDGDGYFEVDDSSVNDWTGALHEKYANEKCYMCNGKWVIG